MTRLLGAILAGGRSRRFGSDKALAMVDGTSLLDRAIAGLAGQVDALVLCGRASVAPAGLPDRPAGGLGPLAGLNAALHHGRDGGFDAVVTVPCDVAIVPDDLVAQLRASGPTAFVADLPVIGLWPTRLADRLDEHIAASSDRSLRGWAAACGARACAIDPVANINTPADLAALIARA